MGYLDEGVLTEILMRLPVKSLLRFKCVNRLWHHVISDPEFAKAQLRMSPSEKLLVPVDCLLDTHGSLDESIFTKLYNPPNNFSILGSCHGLLCLLRATDCREFFVYNPTTRKELRHLPMSGSLRYPNGYEYTEYICGFGYDTLKDDYKLLVVCTPLYPPQTRVVEIYSLRSNSWRSISEVKHYDLQGHGRYSNGFLHWVKKERGADTIVSFDIAAEEFREALLPMPSFRLQGGHVQLSVTGGGTLVVYSTEWPRIEVWIMKDRGSNSTWTELCRFSNEQLIKVPSEVLPNCLAPLIKDGKTLLCVRRRGFPLIPIYDPTEGSFKSFEYRSFWYEITTYVESLVSVHVSNRPLKQA